MTALNIHRSILILTLILLGSIFLVISCARSFNPDIERGSSYKYRRGYPEVRLSALSSWNDSKETLIELTADVVYGSVLFKREGKKRKANLAVQIIIENTDRDSIFHANRFSFDKTISDPNQAKSQDVFTLSRVIKIKPGKYKISLTLIDQHTSRKTTRTVSKVVYNPSKDTSSFTDIHFYAKEIGRFNDTWFPLTTYDVPNRLDSLKFILQINNKSADNLTINSTLIKFRVDTAAAKPMYTNNYSPAGISYKGIDYDKREIIQSGRRILTQQGNVTIEFKFPMLGRGNYRFEVSNNKDSETELYKARDFGIKSKNYPTLKTSEELARPLVYLMKSKEYRKLMEIENLYLLKQEVDRFWLKEIGNRSDAKTIISLYYQRVEEANKLFSNFKEGWKTDRGMVYILFGAPWSVQKLHDDLTWSYSYNRSDHNFNYNFKKNYYKSEFFPFDHFILDRDHTYYQTEYKQVQLWLTGLILVRKL